MRSPLSSRWARSTIYRLVAIAWIVTAHPPHATAQQSPASERDANAAPVSVMLLTGQSSIYHDWRKSSRIIERILEDAGRFEVDVVMTPSQGEPMTGFAPTWSAYDVVVMDYDGDDWPEPVRRSFVEYVSSGGGLVLVHAADNAFPGWPEFQAMAAVGGWRGRDETAGPMLRWREGRQVIETGSGTAQHPPQHDFRIETRSLDHPVMQGLPAIWMHANDELYSQLRGPARNVTILATARAEPPLPNATGEHEPMLMAIRFGEGRVFHTTLGHVGPRDELPVATMSSVGFIVTLQRGTEWAATGRVAQPVPDDFPGPGSPVLRDFR